MTNISVDEESIVYLLNKLVNISKKEILEDEFTLLTKQLLHTEEYAIYSLIKFLMIKYRKIGILKSYKISELQAYFKWKKTQLNYYLKKATKQNVLLYSKRKYSLNLDNILVKRVWNYCFTTTKNKYLSSNEMAEITSKLKQKNSLEIQIFSLSKYKEDNQQIQNSNYFIDFVNEIQSIMLDDCDPKDPLTDLCLVKLSKLVY